LFVGGAAMMFARWADGFKAHANQLPLFDQVSSQAPPTRDCSSL
jgi:hypothetical protein